MEIDVQAINLLVSSGIELNGAGNDVFSAEKSFVQKALNWTIRIAYWMHRPVNSETIPTGK